MLLPLLAGCLINEALYQKSKEAITDHDGDGFVQQDDCDDADGDVFPDAEESCNGIDDDCDGEADNNASDAAIWVADLDGDGHGTITAEGTRSCEQPPRTSAVGDDCDDARADTYPDAPETPYDGIDQDCSGADVTDADGDGYDATEADGDDCLDSDGAIHPSAAETWANGATDDDCDGDFGSATLEYGAEVWVGPVEGAQAGRRVAPLGDIDGDGLPELLVAASRDATWATFGGAVMVLGDDGAGNLVTKARAEGRDEFGFMGADIAGGVDADADGVADYLIGSTGPGEGAGTTWLLPGAALETDDAIEVHDDALLAISGDKPNIYSGSCVAILGDVDGDGITDFGVGAPLSSSSDGEYSGAVAIVSASARGAMTFVEADAVLTGPYTNAGIGNRVFGMEDLDGDGHDDVVVAFGYGDLAFVVAGGITSGNVADIAPVRVSGDASYAVADAWPAGDVDGDGATDLAVILDNRDVRLYTGILASASRGVADWSSAVDGGQYVFQVQSLDDLDGDGKDELLVPTIYDLSLATAVAGLFFGSDWTYRGQKSLSDAPLTAISTRAGAMGYRLTMPGDVDGDGFDDIALGSYSDSAGGVDDGAVALIPVPR